MDHQTSSASPKPSAIPVIRPFVPLAPASTPPARHIEASRPRMPYSCVACSRRKVKCSKELGICAACQKGRLECTYQEPAPRKRKRKPEDDIQERLTRYERLLEDHGLLSGGGDAQLSDSPRKKQAAGGIGTEITSAPASGEQITRTGTLLKGSTDAGRTRYIDSNIWRNLGEDLHPSSDEEDNDAPVSTDPLDPASAVFIFGSASPTYSLLDAHPSYNSAMKLWELYKRNVDPIIRILHLPTSEVMVQKAATDPSSMSKVTECLLFAIYHFAIASTDESECADLLGKSWPTLQQRYHDAARQALVTVRFLRTTQVVVLQAYILFLLSVRNQYDPHTFWILTGIAVRIGQRIGLHRDGESMQLNPFDVQMRRVLFWQLLPLDGLSGQLSGTGIAIAADSWDTRQPLNINDEDIWPGMDSPPVEKRGATDMIFVLARTEIGRFHQKVKPILGNWAALWEGKDVPVITTALTEMENTMEEKYIRFCDISIPIHCLTMAMARGSLQSARLRIKLGRVKAGDASPEERKELYSMASKLLTLDATIRQNKSLNRFNWHMKSFFQWDPLIFVLNEVRRKDTVLDVDTVWSQVEEIYACHPELTNGRRSIDLALGRLTLKAWVSTHPAGSGQTASEPHFITDLRMGDNRRERSRQNATSQGPSSISPFNNAPGIAYDVPASNYVNYGALDSSNSDMDWLYWEQLINDPQSYAIS